MFDKSRDFPTNPFEDIIFAPVTESIFRHTLPLAPRVCPTAFQGI
jgi:hypothetical protein